MTCGQAVQALQVLARFADYDFPADAGRLRFGVARTFAALRSVPEVIAAEAARQAAIRHHGKDDGKGQVRVLPEALAAFLAEYAPVAEQEIELTVTKLPAQVMDFAPPGVTPNDLIPLIEFLEDEKTLPFLVPLMAD
jgi:hypothetical protein